MASLRGKKLNAVGLALSDAAVLVALLAGLGAWYAAHSRLRATSEAALSARERLAVGFASLAAQNQQVGAKELAARAGGVQGLVYLAVLDGSGAVLSAWVDVPRARALLGHSLPRDPKKAVRAVLGTSFGRASLQRYGVRLPDGRRLKLGFWHPRPASSGWWWLVLGGLLAFGLSLGVGFMGRGSFPRAAELLSKGLAERTGERLDPEGTDLDVLARRSSEQLRSDAKALKQVERFFPPALYRLLTEGRRLGSEERPVAVLVVRLKGVSDMLARMDPAKALDRINGHLDAVLSSLGEKGAVVGRIDVDTVVAWWNIPEMVPQAEMLACNAAVEVRRSLFEFQRRQKTVGAEVLHAGVGLAAGRCVLGKVGSLQQMAVTLVGQAVGTAYRLARTAEAEEILVADSVTRLVGTDAWRFDALSVPGDIGTQVWRLVGPK